MLEHLGNVKKRYHRDESHGYLAGSVGRRSQRPKRNRGTLKTVLSVAASCYSPITWELCHRHYWKACFLHSNSCKTLANWQVWWMRCWCKTWTFFRCNDWEVISCSLAHGFDAINRFKGVIKVCKVQPLVPPKAILADPIPWVQKFSTFFLRFWRCWRRFVTMLSSITGSYGFAS